MKEKIKAKQKQKKEKNILYFHEQDMFRYSVGSKASVHTVVSQEAWCFLNKNPPH